jgi:hypothetical protein
MEIIIDETGGFKTHYEQYLKSKKSFCTELLIGYEKKEEPEPFSKIDNERDSYEAFIINLANLQTNKTVAPVPFIVVCYKQGSINKFIENKKSPGFILY